MNKEELSVRRIELLNEIDSEAKKHGIVAIKDTALLNAKNYAREQMQYGHSDLKTQEEFEIIGLERHLRSLKNENDPA